MESIIDPLQLRNKSFGSITGPLSMDIDADYKKHSLSTCTGSNNGSLSSPVLEIQRVHMNYKFSLRGKKNDDNSVSLTLRIADSGGNWLCFQQSWMLVPILQNDI
uniref:Uncharacterized protein n=1 Tax=Rhizophora mucronata TaxID=61149 RepID=A0A2P2MXF6_RHIMU